MSFIAVPNVVQHRVCVYNTLHKTLLSFPKQVVISETNFTQRRIVFLMARLFDVNVPSCLAVETFIRRVAPPQALY